MNRALILALLAVSMCTFDCAMPPKMTLSDINPVRTYNVQKEALFDVLRAFATKEAYKVERFEMESGSIKAHKRLATGSSSVGRTTTSDTRHVIMTLKVREVSSAVMELTASFGYGDYQGTFSSEDEGMLVSEYNTLFSFLQDELK
jgi:hypothetical protein